MTDDSPDRRKRSKWDETERTSSSRDRLSHHRDHRQEEREKSVSSRGGSRWDDRRSRSPASTNPYASRREERRDDRRRSRSPPPVARSTGSPGIEPPVKLDPAAAAGRSPQKRKKNAFLDRSLDYLLTWN